MYIYIVYEMISYHMIYTYVCPLQEGDEDGDRVRIVHDDLAADDVEEARLRRPRRLALVVDGDLVPAALLALEPPRDEDLYIYIYIYIEGEREIERQIYVCIYIYIYIYIL